MSGSSTASSTPPSTSPLSAEDSDGPRRIEDNDGLSAGRPAGFRVVDEEVSRNEQSSGAFPNLEDAQNMEEHQEISRQTSSTDVVRSRVGTTPIDLTRPMPSHPAGHRKRRLASLGEHPRLQRTRSGEAPAREAGSREAFPQRSVSMVVPSSRSGSSTAPGSSYAMAIDITSSPPGQDHEAQVPREEEGGFRHHPAAGAPHIGMGIAGSSASSRRASGQSMGYRDRSDMFRQSQDWQRPVTPVGHAGRGDSLPSPQRASASHRYYENIEGETELPRWQPDSEVTECPICGTVFKLWYRKHHCRKCGRVVCAACSPHRITIPRQYIVRPPDSSSLPTSPPIPLPRQVVDLTGDDPVSSSLINPALGGGEEVRLCNPCVPDPNPHPLNYVAVRPHGHRTTQSLSSTMFPPSTARRPSVMRLDDPRAQERRPMESYRRLSLRQESTRDVRHPYPYDVSGRYDEDTRRGTRRFTGPPALHSSSAAWPPAQPEPPSTAVCERDLCPICGIHFPPINSLAPIETREAHIVHCIESRVAPTRFDSAPTLPSGPAIARMVSFMATEKDCLSGPGEAAECSICMEDYEVGQDLVRLECLCKFHRECIVDWFMRKPECPLHKVSS